mmetsp:Transcript_117780/g.333868  ORF Transcript_117780/g.333868 Transcript_117780/m.333868 type:complete len:270 (-) Transcript_117780:582-1391(-)
MARGVPVPSHPRWTRVVRRSSTAVSVFQSTFCHSSMSPLCRTNRNPSLVKNTSSRSLRQMYADLGPSPRLQRPCWPPGPTTRSKPKYLMSKPPLLARRSSTSCTSGVSPTPKMQSVRVPPWNGPLSPATGMPAAAKSTMCAASLGDRNDGIATMLGSLHSRYATSGGSSGPPRGLAPSAPSPAPSSPPPWEHRSLTLTSVASAKGMLCIGLSTCRILWRLKKQLTPYFTPLVGGRPMCSIRPSSLPPSTFDHITAVPRRGLKLTPSNGK